jgi:predicted phosphohydrolase
MALRKIKDSLGEEFTLVNDNDTVVVSVQKKRECIDDEFQNTITILDENENEIFSQNDMDEGDLQSAQEYLKDLREKIDIVLTHYNPVKKKK